MASMTQPSRTKLETIEAARGLAAFAVVLFHMNAAAAFMGMATFKPLSVGEHGVDFFFVLSGFIVFFVHENDIGRPERARSYFLKRCIRLFPLLWLVVGGWILSRTLVGDPPTLDAIGTSLLLYPSLTDPLPLVVWTLRHEAIFYCAFLVLIISRPAGIAVFLFWSVAVIAQLLLSLLGRPIGGLAAFLLSTFNLDFILGAAVALVHRRRVFRASSAPLLISLAVITLLLSIEEATGISRTDFLDYVSVPATAWTLVLGLGFAAVLHGLLCIERIVRVPPALLLLGGASYAIYLVHTPVNSVAQRIAVYLPPGIGHFFIIAAGVAAGIALHLLYERPVARTLRTKLLPSPPKLSHA